MPLADRGVAVAPCTRGETIASLLGVDVDVEATAAAADDDDDDD